MRFSEGSVWLRVALAVTKDQKLRCSYTVLTPAPITRDQQEELYDFVYAIVRATAEAMPPDKDESKAEGGEAPPAFVPTIIEPQIHGLADGARDAAITAALPADSVFSTLVDGTETLQGQGHTAVIGALQLLVSDTGPDAGPADLLCQAMVFPSIELPWDETLNRIGSGLRITGVIFAIATGNPAVLASGAGGLTRTALTRIVGSLVRSVLRSMFGPSEQVVDLTGPALSADPTPPAPPTARAESPDRRVLKAPPKPKTEKPDRPRYTRRPRRLLVSNEPVVTGLSPAADTFAPPTPTDDRSLRGPSLGI